MIHPSPEPQSLPGSRIRVIFHPGALDDLGPTAKRESATRALLVSDPGIVEAGHVERAMRSLYKAGILTRLYDGVGENPTTEHVARGLAIAKKFEVNFIIGLGGGSSMDCAKGINFLLTNGGKIEDYWGVNKAALPMLPLIAIPTTAGTGSEAQSAALITDPETHNKMACWDEKAAARIAILDPDLTATVPHAVAAATGIDAISHAVETAGCVKRNDVSRAFSREAWALLSSAFVRALEDPADAAAREKMLLGAHLAGCAIENSMLGAAHACANPLTARYNIVHGHAVGVMLPHVVRFNSQNGHHPYADLVEDPHALAAQLTHFLAAADIPATLGAHGVKESSLDDMADMAAKQWTATFNPRKVGVEELRSLYQSAL
ncbi:MAG: iron-containing alcohol dehydrogenase [Phycisphaerales bacterium]|nr:iron-containing alcohol dehydrogenase [Phycisphaerales bacterium]